MADLEIVQCFETSNDLNEVVPYLVLGKLLLQALLRINQLKHIATICVLHHDAETVGAVLKEGLFVADDVGMAD